MSARSRSTPPTVPRKRAAASSARPCTTRSGRCSRATPRSRQPGMWRSAHRSRSRSRATLKWSRTRGANDEDREIASDDHCLVGGCGVDVVWLVPKRDVLIEQIRADAGPADWGPYGAYVVIRGHHRGIRLLVDGRWWDLQVPEDAQRISYRHEASR